MSDTPPAPGEDTPGTDAPGGPDPSETVSLPTTQPQPAYEPPADPGVAPSPEPAAPSYESPAPAPAADPYGAPPAADTGYAAAGYTAATPGYPPTQPQPGYPPPGGGVPPAAGYPPAGGYATPPPAGPPPTQAGWGAGGGAVPPAYGAPPPSGGGGKKALMIVLIVVGVLFLGLVALVLIGVLAGDDDNDAPSVDRTTLVTPTTAPAFDPDTTEGPAPGDSVLDPTTTEGGGTSVDVFDLEVGDCFDVPGSGNISDVEGLDCDQPHDNEVFALFEIDGGPNAPFPGEATISRQAQRRCTGALFTDYVGVPFQESSFSATSINPTRETWERLDDREVICVITGGNGETLTSSAQGANR